MTLGFALIVWPLLNIGNMLDMVFPSVETTMGAFLEFICIFFENKNKKLYFFRCTRIVCAAQSTWTIIFVAVGVVLIVISLKFVLIIKSVLWPCYKFVGDKLAATKVGMFIKILKLNNCKN